LKFTKFFADEYRTICRTKIILHNRQPYLAYGIVISPVTLTDLQTRHAGLSASTEVLVYLFLPARKRGSCYSNVSGWLGGWVAVTHANYPMVPLSMTWSDL